MSLTATRALYIKLGEKNRWAKPAFESNTLRIGFSEFSHERSIAAVKTKDFTPVKNFYENEKGYTPGTATRFSNEVREFYTAGTDVLWITFAEGKLWWCFSDIEVTPNATVDFQAAGSRYRKTIGPWSNKDINGGILAINALRGSLTTTAGFRGTICRVKEFGYLLRRLNGEVTPETEAVRTARLKLIEVLTPLICALHWKDFELLVELVMTQGGWRRVSATGGTQHNIDIELELPLTGERAKVQVKSKLDQGTADEISTGLIEESDGERVFIVYHTGFVQSSVDQDNVTVIGPAKLAEHCVDLGLTTWVMDKVG